MINDEQTYAFADDEAVARLTALGDYWALKYDVHAVWSGSTARLKGRKLGVKYDATVKVGDGRVSVEANVGFLAEKLGGPAYVRRKVADYLDPTNTLESLQARIPR